LFIDDTANKVNSEAGEGGALARKKAEAEAGIKAIVENMARDKAEFRAVVKAKARARAKAEDMARAAAKAEDMARAAAETEVEAMAWTRAQTKAKAKARKKAKAKSKDRAKAEAEAKASAEAESQAEAEIVACEKAEAEARAKAEPIFIAAAEFQASITLLHHLATDCLRLSMHFFHPIQQCAQQVYYTAIPLLPTSSHLQKCSLQSVVDNQLSLVTTFSGAPDTWGLLLRTIDIRPRELTCIATSVQGIIAACGDVVNIYDPVTFVLHQSLSTPEAVTKIQVSPDGTILFFAHSLSVTMWEVQTGGLIHTFTVESEISDLAASTTGDYIACGSSDGSIAFWDIHIKEGRSKHLENGQPIVTVCWVSPLMLAVATQHSIYLHSTAINSVLDIHPIQGQVWGMVCPVVGVMGGGNEGELLVGTLWLSAGVDWYFFRAVKYTGESLSISASQLLTHCGQLSQPMLVGEEIVCIIQPTGVQSFNTRSYNSTNNPTLLDTATSVALSLNRNLVAQTKDSIQIFSLDVLTSGRTRNVIHMSHVYPLGRAHIICIQQTRSLTILELETLQTPHLEGGIFLARPLLIDESPSARWSFGHGPAAEFGVSMVVEMWQSGTPLPEWSDSANEDGLLSGLSPERTHIVTVYGSPRRELRVKDTKDGTVLTNLPLEDDDLTAGEVYDLAFDSETRFYLKIDGPEHHVQIPYDISASPLERCSHTVTKGEPVPLLEPRKTPPYTLDANFEWVLDAGSRKVCWIPPGNVRRSSGGHYWIGLSLVMVGDDGVVRKLSFKEPGC